MRTVGGTGGASSRSARSAGTWKMTMRRGTWTWGAASPAPPTSKRVSHMSATSPLISGAVGSATGSAGRPRTGCPMRAIFRMAMAHHGPAQVLESSRSDDPGQIGTWDKTGACAPDGLRFRQIRVILRRWEGSAFLFGGWYGGASAEAKAEHPASCRGDCGGPRNHLVAYRGRRTVSGLPGRPRIVGQPVDPE